MLHGLPNNKAANSKELDHSGDSGTRATRAEPELQNDAEAIPVPGLLGLSLSYDMMEGLILFNF